MRDQLNILLAVLRRIENQMLDIFLRLDKIDSRIDTLVQQGLRVTLQVADESGEEDEDIPSDLLDAD